MELEVLSKEGTPTGEKIKLPPQIFEIVPSDTAIYRDVVTHMANRRQGTHKTKRVSEVRGSGKKPWRQKHTGRARVGSHRSPLWRGGGAIFGPVPRDYSLALPARVKRLARMSALTYKAKGSEIRIVEDFSFEAAKTKSMASILKALNLAGRRTLLLVPGKDDAVVRSGRNIPDLEVLEAAKASTYNIIRCEILLMQKSALKALEGSF